MDGVVDNGRLTTKEGTKLVFEEDNNFLLDIDNTVASVEPVVILGIRSSSVEPVPEGNCNDPSVEPVKVCCFARDRVSTGIIGINGVINITPELKSARLQRIIDQEINSKWEMHGNAQKLRKFIRCS